MSTSEWQLFLSKRGRLLERFPSLYKVSESGCWEWTANFVSAGYGRTYAAKVDGRDRHILAHRLSYMIHFGRIEDKMCVMHKCDNPKCVNPKHLMIGTKGDNNKDRAAKGRSSRGDNHYSKKNPEKLSRGDSHYSRTRPSALARGSSHGQAKLTERDVIEIRRMKKTGRPVSEITSRFAISRTNAYDILKRRTWKHVA